MVEEAQGARAGPSAVARVVLGGKHDPVIQLELAEPHLEVIQGTVTGRVL